MFDYPERDKIMHQSFIFLLFFSMSVQASEPSRCFGTTDRGRLTNGWQLPSSGSNFSAYSVMGTTLGRNYVHSAVYETVLDAYTSLNVTAPEKRYVYGETGWATGGRFRPHKTHQNGLSVDFFVPVIDKNGKSVPLPTGIFNKLGYNIEFTNEGKFEEYTIDFDALSEHLLALKRAAKHHEIKIWRVIFDNDLQKKLFASDKGKLLKTKMRFSTKKPWVRHDEHYHVDFLVPCDK